MLNWLDWHWNGFWFRLCWGFCFDDWSSLDFLLGNWFLLRNM
jgi:hypothetical protein